VPGESAFSLADFDRYCEAHNVQPGQSGVAFAQWLARISGKPVIGERVSGEGPPTVTGKPPEDNDP
jgi:hypothetical protein